MEPSTTFPLRTTLESGSFSSSTPWIGRQYFSLSLSPPLLDLAKAELISLPFPSFLLLLLLVPVSSALPSKRHFTIQLASFSWDPTLRNQLAFADLLISLLLPT